MDSKAGIAAWLIIPRIVLTTATPLVQAGATQNLVTSRATGNSSYDPSRVISVYYAQARNEQASGNFLVPYSQALLAQAVANFSSAYAKQFFTQQGSNVTAMAILAQAPQTIAQPVYWTYYNLRPFSCVIVSADERVSSPDTRVHLVHPLQQLSCLSGLSISSSSAS